jgi:hypothetical protein
MNAMILSTRKQNGSPFYTAAKRNHETLPRDTNKNGFMHNKSTIQNILKTHSQTDKHNRSDIYQIK